jgi:AraC family transcriptional regulator
LNLSRRYHLGDNSAKTVKQTSPSGDILIIKEATMRSATEQAYKQRILRVLVHIQEHLDDDLPLEALARIACFSPYHFHRIFGAMVGESVKEHVRRLRLERAAYRLEYSNRQITDIAFDAHYETHESFTRAFQAMFGTAPSGYRKQRRDRSRPSSPSGIHYLPEGRLEDFNPIQRGGSPMNVRIETVAPMKVAFLRCVGPYDGDGIAQTWQKLMSWAGRQGLFGPGVKCLGISHDNPHVTPPDKLRYDACIATDRPIRPEGEIGVQEIHGGEYAVVRHKGPYEKLPETYGRLYGEWLPHSGREPAESPGYEHYLNSPQNRAPDDLATDVYVPLKPQR